MADGSTVALEVRVKVDGPAFSACAPSLAMLRVAVSLSSAIVPRALALAVTSALELPVRVKVKVSSPSTLVSFTNGTSILAVVPTNAILPVVVAL